MKRYSLLTVIVSIVITALLVLGISFYVFEIKDRGQTEQPVIIAEPGDYSKLSEIQAYIDKYFVGEQDEEATMDALSSALIDSLGDRWSGYYTAEEYKQVTDNNSNSYVGIGVTIQTDDNGYRVVKVYENAPAAKAGILPGDYITTVNGEPVSEMGSLESVAEHVRGDEGTSVTVGVDRDGEYLEFTMKRAPFHYETVTAEMLDDDIGYLYIDNFLANVDVEFKQKVNDLIDQGAKGLIFDVRFNGGGYVSVLANMLDILLPKGDIITLIDNQGNILEKYVSNAKCIDLPMVVICNYYSISAAEFFPAALQQYGCAKIVGETTMGKGYAQVLFELSDGSAINLSIAKYYTPNGINLAGIGIVPDYEVTLDDELVKKFYSLTIDEDVQLQKAVEVIKNELN